MNCNEVHELLGTAIDGVLEQKAEGEFRQHLALCSPCRNAFELESLAKRVVRRKIKRTPTPPRIYEEVVRTLRLEQEVSVQPTSWVERIVGNRVVIPALITGVAAVIMILMLTPTQRSDLATRHTAPNDVINQSLINFALVRSGDLKPSMVSCYPEGVVGFFERNGIRFAVNVKPLDNCEWYGAISSDYNGVKLAQVVYKLGSELMYVYQVSENEVKEGSLLHLPPAAQEALAKTNWYTDPEHPDCNVVLWKDKGTLCAAVSTMKKDRLLALLTAK